MTITFGRGGPSAATEDRIPSAITTSHATQRAATEPELLIVGRFLQFPTHTILAVVIR